MNEALSGELRDTFREQFMQPVIYLDNYYAVETDNGTEIVPADVVGSIAFSLLLGRCVYVDDDDWEALSQRLQMYCEANVSGDITFSRGYLARLSAPGYMDCTDWSAFDNEDEAARYLIDTYGDDEC